MPSSIFSENKHVRIWIDNGAPFVFTGLRAFPRSENELCDVQGRKMACIRHQFRKYQTVYSIFDASEAEEFDSQMLVTYCRGLADQYRAGLAYKAFLKPANAVACRSLTEALTRIAPGKAGVFDTFDQALTHITMLWNKSAVPQADAQQPAAGKEAHMRWAPGWALLPAG